MSHNLPLTEYALLPDRSIMIHEADYQKLFCNDSVKSLSAIPPHLFSHRPTRRPRPPRRVYRFYPPSTDGPSPTTKLVTYVTTGSDGRVHRQQMYCDEYDPSSGATPRPSDSEEYQVSGFAVPQEALFGRTSQTLSPHSRSASPSLSPLASLSPDLRDFESPRFSPPGSDIWRTSSPVRSPSPSSSLWSSTANSPASAPRYSSFGYPSPGYEGDMPTPLTTELFYELGVPRETPPCSTPGSEFNYESPRASGSSVASSPRSRSRYNSPAPSLSSSQAASPAAYYRSP
ncbi:hypothetical protein GYMLUDRAFT_55660 [Collybiopsis luxurians FD-317 M1]|nr:hypothetical protein GYMLUDRAFT_55660 [Collybiopsis luxurians FD-317 M1]